MASDSAPASRAAPPRFPFVALLGCRLVQARNAVDQRLREAPGRAFAVLVLLGVIWFALYWLLSLVLSHINRWELVALVAKQYIFIYFFLALAVLLAFSSAVLTFSSLYGRQEAGHLLALPISPRQVVAVKWLEGMALSSWSFLLLGVPLMFAVARHTRVEWYYYPLFAGHFLGFVLIPSTLGMLAAWAVAMWAPRRPLAVLIWCGVGVALAAALWLARIFQNPELSDRWLTGLYTQLSLSRNPLLPSTWSARGVVAALERRVDVSLLYLGAVLANGLFLAWLAANLLGRTWATAYSRAQQARGRGRIRHGWFTESLNDLLFFYLPPRLKALMLKDLRSFARDATQWMQMFIMLGLLVLYAANLRRLPVDYEAEGMRVLLAFLNLTVVSLILATFTSRFVFPLLSLETQQLWLLGLLPTRRTTLLLVKFIFALTVTGLAGLLVVLLSARALALPPTWTLLQAAVCLGSCIGLAGLSVGLGARFPVLGQRNPARIAAGFGGTVNLIASMLFVAAKMAGLAAATLARVGGPLDEAVQVQVGPLALIGLPALGVAVAAVSLWSGARHFERLEV